MQYEDKTIVCSDCQAEFTHSATDQQRYAERGFTNEPKRCPDCRARRKAEGDGGRSRGYESGGYGGGGGSRGPKELHDAVCAECGQQTQVPFKPTDGRPVYCRNCFQGKRDTRGSGGGRSRSFQGY